MRHKWLFVIGILGLTLFAGISPARAACVNPDGNAGDVKFNKDNQVMQYCDDTNWRQIGPKANVGPQNCPNIGDTCDDGSIYAGLSPDGDVPMYTTPADAPGTYPWNNGNDSGTYTTVLGTGCADNGPGSTISTCITGEQNTATIVAADSDSSTAGMQPHQAAEYCANLVENDKADWYLPAQEELWVLYNNRVAIGGFSTDRYWSSSERNAFSTRRINFGNGAPNQQPKQSTVRVRCVRKEATEVTSVVPNGLIGHWKLDETSGTGIIDYASNNDGTVQGGLDPATDSVQGRVGRALNFDGSLNHITVPYDASLALAGDFTISTWIKPTGSAISGGLGDAFYSAIGTGDGAAKGGTYLAWKWNGGKACIRTIIIGPGGWPGDQVNGCGAYLFDKDHWYHIVLVNSFNTFNVYVNNKLYKSLSLGTYNGNPGNPIYIGTWKLNSRAFEGVIDDLRMYDRALTAEEIQYIHKSFDANVTYDTDARVPKYFNGDDWVAMGESQYVPNAVRIKKGDEGDQVAASTHPSVMDPSKSATGSVWFKFNKSEDIPILTNTLSSGLVKSLRVDGTIDINGYNSSDTAIMRWDGSAGVSLDDGQWHHVLYSFDLSDPSRYHLFVDGVDIANSPAVFVDEAIDHDTSSTEHFKIPSNPATSDFNMADFWFSTDTYIDLSVEANRRKFIDEAGNPVYLGSDGSLPTGSAPDIFLSGATDSWHTNKGTGGGFTENGELTDAITKPGDIYAAAPTNGLIRWWKLDETSGTGIIDYASGNNGTVEGGLDPARHSVGGVFGRALDFDGVDSYIDIGQMTDAVGLGAVTISFWMKPDDLPTVLSDNDGLVIQHDNFANQWGCRFDGNGNKLTCYVEVSGDVASAGGDYTALGLNAGDWTHVAYSFNSGDSILYINGTAAASGTNGIVTNIPNLSNNMRIGGLQGGNGGYFNGVLDDVRIYGRELSAAEVQSLYDAARCTNPDRFAGTMVYNADHNVLQYCDATLPGNGWQATMP